MANILITGGAGFVGRHFTKRFLEQGHDVTVVDNIAPLTGGIHPDHWTLFRPFDYESFKFVQQDCREWFKENPEAPFDKALHLAAMVGGRLMIENNPLAVADDLAIDAAYWQWAVTAKPKKTLCFSSSAAYPVSLQTKDAFRLLDESDITFSGAIGMPDMTYGWAKLTCEYLARLAYEKHGLYSICYRPFSGYGNDQDDAYPFPSICKRVWKAHDENKSAITVWGSGHQMRDFIHIEDCVDGVLTTMDKVTDGSAVNLSTGKYTSFIDFARAAGDIIGYYPEVTGTSDKPEGVFARGGQTTLQTSFGFTPRTTFERGIFQFYNEYGNLPTLR